MSKKKGLRRVVLPLIVVIIIIIPLYLFISNYIESRPKLEYVFNENTRDVLVPYPDVKFAVISDLHYYDISLGDSGSAFEAHLLTDRKLFRESAELLDLAVEAILKSDVDYVLVPGDLTKDGELICHEYVIRTLGRLIDGGKRVFVVPGNHDVSMLHGAVGFEGDKTEPVETITAELFASLYHDFGYGEALFRDEHSLSYAAELNNSLWLVGIDVCSYRENTAETDMVGGKLNQDQLDWLGEVLKKANEQQKAVIVMMHHGVVEHWEGQSKLHPDYLVEEYQYFSKFLASYGVRLVFTGHYHAQDIALADFGDGGFIYDIETGSLVTPPCPMRYCTITGNQIDVESSNQISRLRPGTDFVDKSAAFVINTIELEAFKTLRGYYVPESDAQSIAEFVAEAFVAHYLGDENPEKRPEFDLKQIGLWSRFIYSQYKYAVEGLWQDLYPADVDVNLDLSTRN